MLWTFSTTVLSTSLGKTLFAWRYILNENVLFWLTTSYEKKKINKITFVFSVSVFCAPIFNLKFNLRPKIKSTVKNWSDLCNFYNKIIFLDFVDFLSEKTFFHFSLLNLNNRCFTTILWKIQKNWTSGTWNIHFYSRLEKWKYFFLKPVNRMKLWVYIVTTNDFKLHHNKSLGIYIFCVKR